MRREASTKLPPLFAQQHTEAHVEVGTVTIRYVPVAVGVLDSQLPSPDLAGAVGDPPPEIRLFIKRVPPPAGHRPRLVPVRMPGLSAGGRGAPITAKVAPPIVRDANTHWPDEGLDRVPEGKLLLPDR